MLLSECWPWFLNLNRQHFPFGNADRPWGKCVLTALQPSPVETCSQFGARETFLPFGVQFPAEPK